MMWGAPATAISALAHCRGFHRTRSSATRLADVFIVAAPCDQGFHDRPEPFLSTMMRRPASGSTTWTCWVVIDAVGQAMNVTSPVWVA